MEEKDLATRVARWALLLEEFDYSSEHRKGIRMQHVDVLSRYPVMTIMATDGLRSKIVKAQGADEEILTIKEILKEKPYEDYLIKDDILYKFKDGAEVVVIPKAMQNGIIKSIQEEGHYAMKCTEENIKQEFYIRKLREKIEKVIGIWVKCILYNRKRGKQEGHLKSLA